MLDYLFNVEIPRLHTWAPPAVGMLTTGFALLAFRLFLPVGKISEEAHSAGTSGSLPDDPYLACLAERRIAGRHGAKPLEIILCGTETAIPPRGIVLDRSLGGLGLSVPLPLPSGTLIGVRRLDSGHRTPRVQLEVTHCQPHGRTWKVGGPFVNAPVLSALLFS